MQKYTALGIMSGTSLDGIDLAICEFEYHKKWSYAIKESKTLDYSNEWITKLKTAGKLSGLELTQLHSDYGKLIGKAANAFLQEHHAQVDFIASHGHTIFHQPEKGITLQIGSGADICAQTKIKTVSDFRSLDVKLGGQGAPLVPIGDQLLFAEYDACINIGGFANLSFNQNQKRIAYDICPANIILNYLTNKLELDYDKDGEIGKTGKVNLKLLQELNSLPYYNLSHPKSLGREWLENEFIPIVNNYNDSVPNLLATIYEHIAYQITRSLDTAQNKVLITGGGAFNKFLIESIKQKTKSEIIIPNKQIVDYKEALIFAFLGVLRIREEINTLSSVTGASRDSSGGQVFIP